MRKIGSHGSAKLTTINAAAAAIDIGSKMHMAAVDPACSDNPVRSFGTFTRDLHQLAQQHDRENAHQRGRTTGGLLSSTHRASHHHSRRHQDLRGCSDSLKPKRGRTP